MKTHHKDLFISYGCRESLNFVASLHQRLKLASEDREKRDAILKSLARDSITIWQHEAARGLQCIDFTDNKSQQDYKDTIADILNILHQETTYYKHHKILLVQALRWQRQQQSAFLFKTEVLDALRQR